MELSNLHSVCQDRWAVVRLANYTDKWITSGGQQSARDRIVGVQTASWQVVFSDFWDWSTNCLNRRSLYPHNDLEVIYGTLFVRPRFDRARVCSARQSGKPEWWVMAIPVLKNRLLQITAQAFKESDFGALTFREFLQNNANVLEIDNSFLPGAVTVKSAQSIPRVPSTSTPQRTAFARISGEPFWITRVAINMFGIPNPPLRSLHPKGLRARSCLRSHLRR